MKERLIEDVRTSLGAIPYTFFWVILPDEGYSYILFFFFSFFGGLRWMVEMQW